MDLMRHPELADRLAAAYGLGTLRGGARRRFEAQARRSPTLRALAIAWQERLAAMTELQPGEEPSPNVWKRIRLQLDRERAQRQGAARTTPWRGFALAGAFASVAALAVAISLVLRLQAAPDIRYVAMLADERAAPAMLVTFDPKHGTLTLKRVGGFDEGAEKSLQLWALPPGSAPRSLGVLPQGATVKLTAAEGQVREVPALAISLEPKGGVAGDKGPTGPVLFKGALVPTT
ncbi:anti-sigma factor [Ramlibacter sp. PS4R-6]|uniref:anti-sigma factor n=1 Tax=Ramlibacter sp. PS4R-6 TaxID=3133438 RepID=UPI0030A2C440